MGARKIEVMSQDEITLQMFENETEMEVNEDQIEVDQIEPVQTAKVVNLSDFRKLMGYSK